MRAPRPRIEACESLPRSRVAITPGRRLSVSAMVTSGRAPMSLEEMASTMPVLRRLISSASRRDLRIPTTTTSCGSASATGSAAEARTITADVPSLVFKVRPVLTMSWFSAALLVRLPETALVWMPCKSDAVASTCRPDCLTKAGMAVVASCAGMLKAFVCAAAGCATMTTAATDPIRAVRNALFQYDICVP